MCFINFPSGPCNALGLSTPWDQLTLDTNLNLQPITNLKTPATEFKTDDTVDDTYDVDDPTAVIAVIVQTVNEISTLNILVNESK